MVLPDSQEPLTRLPLPTEPSRTQAARHALLSAVERSERRALWLQGALWSVGAAAVLLVAAALVARASTGFAWALLFLCPLAVLPVLGWFGLVQARRRVGSPERTARLIGERLPGVSLDLLVAVELERELAGQPSFSPALAERFLGQLDHRLARVSAVNLQERRPLRRAGAAAGAGLLLLVITGFGLEGGLWARWRTASRAGAAAAVQREPITGDIELSYRYPAYTGLAPRTIEGSPGDVSAPEGTEVHLKSRSDRPVERAGLLVNGKPVPLLVQGGRELNGSFLVEKSGSYAFVFYSGAGREVARGPDLPLTAEPDSPPQVSLQLPTAELEVDPNQDVILKYQASDDYGLSSLALVYRIGNGPEARIALPLPPGRRWDGTYRWGLTGLRLRPGGRVVYNLEAKDNNAIRGPQKGVSRSQLLRVYSAAEHRRQALLEAQALWERVLKQLADRLEGPDRATPKDSTRIAQQSAVDDAGQQLSADLLSTARKLAHERERPVALIGGLLNVGDSLGRAVRRTSQARSLFLRFGAQSADYGRHLGSVVEQEIAELEKDALYLETLLDRQRLQALRELTRDLASERRELTSLVERFAQTKDPALQKEILRQAAALKDRIAQLMQRMAELSKGIRDEHVNLEAVQEMAKQRDLQGQMDNVQKLLEQGKAEQALLQLQKLAAQIDDMQKSLDQAQRGQNQSNPELVRRFRDFADQLGRVETEQKKVADETKRLRDRYRSQIKQRLLERARALRAELQRDAQALAKDYGQVSPQDMSSRADEPLQRAREELENLQNALKVEDYDLAAESADRVDQDAQEISRYAEQQRRLDEYYQNPPSIRAHSQKLSQKMNADASRAHDLNRKLQELFPPAGSLMSEQDKAHLNQLSGAQRKLAQKAKELQQKMDSVNQLAPVFGNEGTQQMEGISERMEDADQRLENKDPGRGYGSQKEALEGMEQLKKQMQQSQSGGGQGGLPLPMMAGSPDDEGNGDDLSHEHIEIPDQDQFQSPKEFRKDLLDAMKQGTPERYRDQVKHYYEELVK